MRTKGKSAIEKDKKSELEEILIDAIDRTRLQIFKRKLAQEKGLKQKSMIKRVQELGKELDVTTHNGKVSLNHSLESTGFSSVEPTLLKLNEFIN